MRWPSCQVKRKHGCRPLEQSGWSQEGTTGPCGTATRRQWEGQTTSWFQDHVWYQLGDLLSLHRRDFTYFASIFFSCDLDPRARIFWACTIRSDSSTFETDRRRRVPLGWPLELELGARANAWVVKISSLNQRALCLHV